MENRGGSWQFENCLLILVVALISCWRSTRVIFFNSNWENYILKLCEKRRHRVHFGLQNLLLTECSHLCSPICIWRIEVVLFILLNPESAELVNTLQKVPRYSSKKHFI
jgi:hypothetical protein